MALVHSGYSHGQAGAGTRLLVRHNRCLPKNLKKHNWRQVIGPMTGHMNKYRLLARNCLKGKPRMVLAHLRALYCPPVGRLSLASMLAASALRALGPSSFRVEPNSQNHCSSSSPVGLWAGCL